MHAWEEEDYVMRGRSGSDVVVGGRVASGPFGGWRGGSKHPIP
jgi:hypothetical protein